MKAFKSLKGTAAPLLQPNIDTEVIIRIDRLIEHDPDKLGDYCFESLRFHVDGSENPDFVLNQPRYRSAAILLAGENFGYGSSREAAVWSLLDFGVRCVVAPSFGDIFYENCLQNGLLPAIILRDDLESLAHKLEGSAEPVLAVDLATQSIRCPDGTVYRFNIDLRRREALLQGYDQIDLTLKHHAAIIAHQSRHRTLRPWAYPGIDDPVTKVLMIAGDGIGPEIMAQVKRIALWFRDRRGLPFELRETLYGIESWKKDGAVVSEQAWQEIRSADAILFGATGSPEYANVPVEQWRPDNLLRIRRELHLYANLRPVRHMAGAAESSTLKQEIIADVDLIIVRELTGGAYFGEPRGIVTLQNGSRRAVNTIAYETGEIERIARVAFDLARVRRGAVCSVDKANVLETGELWREVVQRLADREYSDVILEHMYVDNAAMQLVRAPGRFDVLLTENLFGDILSDCAATIAGSIGMLPSASIGGRRPDGRPERALYEPIHGSAPDIAGKGIANPIGAILSLAMCMQLSLAAPQEANLLVQAIERALQSGARTPDIAPAGMASVATEAVGDAVLNQLEHLHLGDVWHSRGACQEESGALGHTPRVLSATS